MNGDLVDLARLGGGRVALSASAVREFAAGLDGLLVRPGDPAWDQAVSVWNGRVVRTPALVVRPASTSDVAAAVDLARRHRVLLSVKGGGHSLAGTGLADSALTLDMSSLREVKVDPATRQAQVGSGCLLGTSTGPPSGTGWRPCSDWCPRPGSRA